MAEFIYQDPFPLEDDTTEYRLLTGDYVSMLSSEVGEITKIEPEGLTLLAEEAFRDVSHLFRTSHLEKLKEILQDIKILSLFDRRPGRIRKIHAHEYYIRTL